MLGSATTSMSVARIRWRSSPTGGRRPHAGAFRTKVITRGRRSPAVLLRPVLTSEAVLQGAQGALRTETVISDTRDFGIGRRVNATNWSALRAVGQAANRRLCDAEASDAVPASDLVTFEQVTVPSDDPDGLHAPGPRFGDRRMMAMLAAIGGFSHLAAGFDDRRLTSLVSRLLDRPYTSRQATHDLRRLRSEGIVERLAGSRRHQLTPLGRGVAVLFTKAYGRVLAPGLVQLDPELPGDPTRRSPLARAWHRLNNELDGYIAGQLTAA
jgi:hypothetical protein